MRHFYWGDVSVINAKRLADLSGLLSGTAAEQVAKRNFPELAGTIPAGTYPAGWVPAT